MNNIIVVNENDEVIGAKPIDVVDKEGLIYRVSALWIWNSQGDNLLARRAYDKKHHPGKWGPAVAGTVEENESYQENILKEAEEELGITNTEFKLGPKTRTNVKYNHFTQWFTCVIDKPLTEFKIQKEEVAEIKWFSAEELKREIKENPNEFTPSMNEHIHLFLKS